MLFELRKTVPPQANNTDLSTDKFVQSLYAIVLDCLDIPIVEHAKSRQPSPEAIQQQTAPQQAQGLQHQAGGPHRPSGSLSGNAHYQADDQHLHDILLGDDADNDHPAAHTEANIRKGRSTDTDLNTADNPAVDMDMAAGTQAEGSPIKVSHETNPGLCQPAQVGTTLGHAGMHRPVTMPMQRGLQAGQNVLERSRPSALLLPPYALLPPQVSAIASAAGASVSHSLTSTPDVSAGAPHDRLLPDPPMAGVSLLDALPDAPLRAPPSSGPKGQPPPPSTDVPMIEADTEPNSASGFLRHPWQNHQLPASDSAAARLTPMQDSTMSPAQSDEHTGRVSPNLFMTEADLLVDSPGPPSQQPAEQDLPAVHDLPPTCPKPAETSAGTAGTAPLTSHPVQLISAASLAARAHQRQQSAAAPAILLAAAPAIPLTSAPAAAPLAAPTAAPARPPTARPPTPNRNMYTKSSSVHRRKPDPAKVLLETKVGSLYAIYCLHETQPGRVPVYLPLELLHQLLDIVKEAHAKLPCDVVQVVAQLMRKKAFVVGAIRRPPRDSTADEASQQPPNRSAVLLC